MPGRRSFFKGNGFHSPPPSPLPKNVLASLSFCPLGFLALISSYVPFAGGAHGRVAHFRLFLFFNGEHTTASH